MPAYPLDTFSSSRCYQKVIFNPGAFIDVIKCSCTDAFQSAFPQGADCFEKTNQTAVLHTQNLRC
ncbi:hypothetical protein BGW80DRAFT_1317309 [Lactifluus volemus]|nr:hypothetical protein BGW80DRAFT_1317309 [Lactifluus volemus]